MGIRYSGDETPNCDYIYDYNQYPLQQVADDAGRSEDPPHLLTEIEWIIANYVHNKQVD